MLYLDTSVLVSAMTSETASPRIQHWLKNQEAGSLQISYWTTTEFSSALSLKIRTSQINLAQRAEALSAFADLKRRSLDIVRVARRHFDLAARLADDASLGLRASDALHLAISMDLNSTLCTLDQKLANAASAAGVKSLVP